MEAQITRTEDFSIHCELKKENKGFISMKHMKGNHFIHRKLLLKGDRNERVFP
jgi:hypothetical protein